MNDDTRWERAASILVKQRRSLTPIEALPESIRPRDEVEGYALQSTVSRALEDAGLGRVVGHKIGCTTPVMQAYMGIATPAAGSIHERAVLHRTARLPRSRFVKLGVECEIAVELARDLEPEESPLDRESVAAAVGAVMAAIEIVDDRYRDYRTLGVPTLIADDFFHSGCVLGERVTDWQHLDLAALTGVTRIDGIEAGRGNGSLVMGHPLNALAWFANARAMHGLPPLKAGEFVLLGSVVETKWLDAGQHARIEIDALGALEVQVER